MRKTDAIRAPIFGREEARHRTADLRGQRFKVDRSGRVVDDNIQLVAMEAGIEKQNGVGVRCHPERPGAIT